MTTQRPRGRYAAEMQMRKAKERQRKMLIAEANKDVRYKRQQRRTMSYG